MTAAERLTVVGCWVQAVQERGPMGAHDLVLARYAELLTENGHPLTAEPDTTYSALRVARNAQCV